MSKSFNESLEILFDKMEDFISTKTVVGESIVLGDVTLVPIIEVSVGLGAGGNDKTDNKGCGGGGLGAKITPSAVIAITNGNIQLINIKNQDAVSKLIDMAPGVVSKLNFGSVFGNRNKDKEQSENIKFEEETVVEK